jgi:hypothetical protein
MLTLKKGLSSPCACRIELPHVYALRSMLWKEEGPLEAQLPIGATVIGRQNIPVGG